MFQSAFITFLILVYSSIACAGETSPITTIGAGTKLIPLVDIQIPANTDRVKLGETRSSSFGSPLAYCTFEMKFKNDVVKTFKTGKALTIIGARVLDYVGKISNGSKYYGRDSRIYIDDPYVDFISCKYNHLVIDQKLLESVTVSEFRQIIQGKMEVELFSEEL